MGKILDQIKALVSSADVRISAHGYDELSDDDLTARDIVSGVSSAVSIEEYPDFPKGQCVLVLQRDNLGAPIHVVWGIPKGYNRPAVVVTAYRPDPTRWTEDFRRRR
ncbi:MAG: DUF4258 domain-containing protein [Spirochaetaceae bacterium]|nr:MAG: DUF4258 domain-containing protein [Spirochaetaceae bacterium]